MTIDTENLVGKFRITFSPKTYPSLTRKIILSIDATYMILGSFSWVDYSNDEFGIEVISDDIFKTDINDREFWIILSTFKIEIFDKYNYLGRILNAPNCKLNSVTLEYQRKDNGTTDYYTYFSGFWDHKVFMFDETKNLFTMEFSPQSEKLNYSPTHIGETFNNLLGDYYDWNSNQYVLVKTLITDLYKIIDPDISVEFTHDWTWKAEVSPPPRSFEVNFDNLYVRYRGLFQTLDGEGYSPNGYKTYMKVLKALAFDLGCVTGMISQKRAIFKVLHPITSYRQVTVNSESRKQLIFKRPYQKLNYLVLRADNTLYGESGTDTGIEEEKLEIFVYQNVYRIFAEGNYYTVGYIKSSEYSYKYKYDFLADYWGEYYLSRQTVRRDELILPRTDILIRDCLVLGDKYFITELVQNLTKEESTYKLIPYWK
ncbi:MAG: hypothetical protein KF721_04770 [Ignavibacteriaceae bacterium]|nr:hypothetical protein [Ignavibacteriaceae bacterium]